MSYRVATVFVLNVLLMLVVVAIRDSCGPAVFTIATAVYAIIALGSLAWVASGVVGDEERERDE